MAGAGECGEEEKHLVGRVQGYPRDLLQQFSGGVAVPEEAPAAGSGGTEEDSGEIELSLGLSLGGCFGVDPARRRGLQRSSSVAAIPLPQQQREEEEDPAAPPPLKRTTSLPAEAEEEQRKRKEQHCLRRAEAKRKKPETANGSHPWARDPAPASGEQEAEGGVPGRARRPGTEQPDGWWAPNRVAALGGPAAAAAEGTRVFAAASQGSVGSQGSSSSRASDFGSRPPGKEEVQNNDRTDLWRSSSRTQPALDLGERKAPTAERPARSSAAAGEEGEVEAPWKEQPAAAGGMCRRNGAKGAMEEMPCVSTSGVGPGGRLVEGFLYKYGKGEEVRIVCVCHGRFLSPAEFVRHAGGGDVAHPLRHIIVNPSPSCLL